MDEVKPVVLFETEGSYPYSGGGVSTWAHILCTELQEEVDFHLMAITGNPFVEPRYKLPKNVTDIIHIPLWGVEEPVHYFDKTIPFSAQIEKKARTTKEIVKKQFLPLFKDFISCLNDPFQDVDRISDVIYGFWKYFQYYDYKITMKEPMLWLVFKESLFEKYVENYDPELGETPKVIDMTF